jgi:hypothetical protein
MTTGPTTRNDGRTGQFNYLDPSVRHSLYRNGEVLTRRDSDGSDTGTQGVVLEQRKVRVRNARLSSGTQRSRLAANGFELLSRPLLRPDLDFFDHPKVVRDYYPECAELVQQTTRALQVLAFDHNIRSAAGKQGKRRIRKGQQVQGPAHIVHGDYTLSGAPERLRDLAKPPSGNDTLRSILNPEQSLLDPETVDRALGENGRFALINVWRNIAKDPVASHPLALCDAQSVSPEDLVVFEIHYRDRVGENYFARYSPRHQWHYFPAASHDEALLIKQWDSAGNLARSRGSRSDADDPRAPCTFSFHSAFADPSTPPDAPERWSIEVRCVAIYE